MSQHMVIFRPADGSPAYSQFESVSEGRRVRGVPAQRPGHRERRMFELARSSTSSSRSSKVELKELNPAPSAPASPSPSLSRRRLRRQRRPRLLVRNPLRHRVQVTPPRSARSARPGQPVGLPARSQGSARPSAVGPDAAPAAPAPDATADQPGSDAPPARRRPLRPLRRSFPDRTPVHLSWGCPACGAARRAAAPGVSQRVVGGCR